ncbi:hypothetical protein NNJEOMEG_01425 [Fundidesulfovibrio magnetotacticus]|uniref:Glycosyltransferase RgtA/B/C/D-like domain-containing protein n=1 Tax=Fundidesulfovibrio magnetotacticus TaxID=2730080 RepID=A0A6V8LSN3_9BACT|nr:hypothetical protein [Fundidesulfovibrio magnetotacticus]GFK93591.1 hypothetical protein NNJEOMEG_01425 [Fundidesulfovibrio magnetotacticus]
MLQSLLALAELWLLAASWYRLQDGELTVADAMARSLALSLASLGLVSIALFAAGLARLHHLLDAGVLGFACYSAYAGQRRFLPELRHAGAALAREPLAWCLGAAALALLVQALAAPPANWDSMTYNLARVLLMMQENTLFPVNYNTFRQLAFSPGFDLLHFFFLRLGTDAGVAVFAWAAWCCVILSAYALARERGPRPMALAVALVTASLKLLALQATSTKNDIGAAAMACACLLGLSALLRRGRAADAAFLAACVVYGLSVKTYFAFFVLCLGGSLLLFHRRELASLALGAWRASPRGVLAGLGLTLAGACLALVTQIVCLLRFGDPFGPEPYVSAHRNLDGLAGLASNLVRYALQLPDLPGTWWTNLLRQAHRALLGGDLGPGAAMGFAPGYGPGAWWSEDVGWFGPVALLAAGCALAGLFSRERFVRTVSWALAGTALCLSATIAWMGYNGRFFSLVFACSALPLAWAARWWWAARRPRCIVLGASLAVLCSVLLLNQEKPLLDHTDLGGAPTDWAKALQRREGGRRGVYDEHFNSFVFLEYLKRGTFPDRRILLVAGPDSWVYPPLFFGAHRWVVTGRENPVARLDGEFFDIRDCGRLRELARRFDLVVVMEHDEALACIQGAGWREVLRTVAHWGPVAVFEPGPAP